VPVKLEVLMMVRHTD